MMVLSIVVLLALIGVVFYHRVNLALSSLLLLAFTAAMGAIGLWTYWMLVPLAIVLLPLNIVSLRRSLLSAPALRAFRKVMPPMSTTEKEAIDAGTTWWEGDLFQPTGLEQAAQLSTAQADGRRASLYRRPGRRSLPHGQ